MKLCDINPHLRFAAQTRHIFKDNPVKVTDCRIFYVVSGAADIYIENQHYILVPGSLFYCTGGSEYNMVSPRGFCPICINFDLNQKHNSYLMPFFPHSISTDMSDILFFHDEVEDSTVLSSHFFLKDGSRYYRYIEKILEEFSGNALCYQEICSSILKELLIELHRFEKSSFPPKLNYVIKYMEANYNKNLSNKDLADLVGYHSYHLNRLFLTYTGTNMHSYLLRIRLNQAKYLLLNTDIPLKAIPEKIGFNSYSHFSSYFKQQFGVAPVLYRNSLKGNI